MKLYILFYRLKSTRKYIQSKHGLIWYKTKPDVNLTPKSSGSHQNESEFCQQNESEHCQQNESELCQQNVAVKFVFIGSEKMQIQ